MCIRDSRKKYLESWRKGLTGGLNYYRAARLKSPVGGERADAPPFSIPKNPIITVPTLVIWGLKDTALLQGNLDGLEHYVKVLEIERVPEGSHWVVRLSLIHIFSVVDEMFENKFTGLKASLVVHQDSSIFRKLLRRPALKRVHLLANHVCFNPNRASE